MFFVLVIALDVVRVQCAYYHSAPLSSYFPGIVSHAVIANVNAPATWPHSGDGLTGMPSVLFICAMDARKGSQSDIWAPKWQHRS